MTNEEALKSRGKKSLENAIRKEALHHVLKYDLDAECINEATCNIAREVESYQDETEDAA